MKHELPKTLEIAKHATNTTLNSKNLPISSRPSCGLLRPGQPANKGPRLGFLSYDLKEKIYVDNGNTVVSTCTTNTLTLLLHYTKLACLPDLDNLRPVFSRFRRPYRFTRLGQDSDGGLCKQGGPLRLREGGAELFGAPLMHKDTMQPPAPPASRPPSAQHVTVLEPQENAEGSCGAAGISSSNRPRWNMSRCWLKLDAKNDVFTI